MGKRNEYTPRKKYPEPVPKPKFGKNIFASHKHANSNSNAICNNENLIQQTRNIFEKIGAYFSNTVKQKPKNVIFTDSMSKSLRINDFNENLNKWKYCLSQAVPRIKGNAYESSCNTNFRKTST